MNAIRGNAGGAIATIKPQDGATLPVGELMERIIAAGDISQLGAGDRAHYLVRVAESAGLNALSQPFDLIPDKGGRLKLYPNKSATDQLRKLYRLQTITRSARELNGVYMVEVEVTDGRRSESNIGAVTIDGLRGEALANALMKCHTKAKRRATLDWCGLGILDETEIEGLAQRDRAERPDFAAWEASREAVAGALSDGIPDAVFGDQGSGELGEPAAIGQDIKAHLIATGRMHPEGPESIQSVKVQIHKLTQYAEWSDEDLAVVATELHLPPWRDLKLADAQVLRNDIMRRVGEAEADGEGVDAEDAESAGMPDFFDAESVVAGEPGLDQHTA